MARRRRRLALHELELVAAAVAVVGVVAITRKRGVSARRGRLARNAGPDHERFDLPRPLRRVRPRLSVVQGGASEREDDPFDRLLVQLFDPDPRGGAFYQIRTGDTPETVARAVLQSVGRYTKANVLDYIHVFSSSRYNLDRYGSPSTSRSFDAAWLVPGIGQGLRAAFLPRNADALEAIAHRRLPRRTTDARTGEGTDPNADQLGVIWLPPVSADDLAQGRVTCAHRTWDDGSSSIEPPPAFFAHMVAA